MATKVDDEQKSLNPADGIWADKLAQDLHSLETVGNPQEEANVRRARKVLEGEDEDTQDQDNTDPVKKGENNVPQTPSREYTSSRSFSRLAARLLPGSKGSLGATGGIVGLLIGMFSLGGLFSGAFNALTFFTNLGSSHFDLGHHLFVKSGNSFIGSMLLGESRSCSTSKIKCKLTSLSDKRKQQWEARKIEVIAEKSKFVPNRWVVRGLKFPNGTIVDSRKDWKNLRISDPDSYSRTKWIPVRAWINAKGPGPKAWAKFTPNLGKRLIPNKSKDRNERRQGNNQAIDQHTGAVTGDNDSRIRAISQKVKSSPAYTKAGEYMKKITNVTGGAKYNIAVAAAMMGCHAYNLVRATSAAMQVYWYQQLATYLLPFIQAGSQIMYQGDLDWELAEYLGNRMTGQVTREMVDRDPNDVYTEDMIGKTAMDADGIFTMLNGDTKSLNGYTADYTAWSPVSQVKGAGIINKINEVVKEYVPGGTTSIKATCQVAKAANYLSMVGCVANLPACVGQALIINIAASMFGDDVEKWIVDQLEKPAFEAIAKANLTSDLIGPPLGQSLVAAFGLVTNAKDRASGFQASATKEDMLVTYNALHEDIIEEKIAEAKTRTLADQFNVADDGSFANELASKVATIPLDGKGFSILANLTSLLGKGVGALADISTAEAYRGGLLQPISTFSSDKTLSKAIENCDDYFKHDIGFSCVGSSAQVVPYIHPIILQCMEEEEANESTDNRCVEKAVDFLSKKKYKNDDDKEVPYIDADTGKPTDMGKYNKSNAGPYKNPFLMYMANCGRDRVFDIGYTDRDITDDDISWYSGALCGNRDDQGDTIPARSGEVSNGRDEETLAWMSYYYTECIALYASEEGLDYCWDDVPTPETTPSQPSTPPANTNGTIALDPGHSIPDINDPEPETGATLSDYPNGAEVHDMWDVANMIKEGLEREGYTVKMLRDAKEERVNFQERADRAKGSAMTVSLHTNAGGDNFIASQMVGGHRVGPRATKTFENADTADKSQKCAAAMANAMGMGTQKGIEFPATRGLATGNLPWVQLLSPDTPWVYVEVDPADSGGGSGAISEAAKRKYADGVIAGIKACDLPKGDTAAEAGTCKLGENIGPEILEKMNKIVEACKQALPKLTSVFASPAKGTPIIIAHDTTCTDTHGCVTSDNQSTIHVMDKLLNAPYFEEYYRSFTVHELAHTTHPFPWAAEGWFMEGVADWARNEAGYATNLRRNVCTDSHKRYDFDNGYGCAAALLQHIQNAGGGSVKQFQADLGANKSLTFSRLIQDRTGKTIELWWSDCISPGNPCAGGNP